MSNRIEDRSEIHASPLPFLQRLPSSNAVQDNERGAPISVFSSGSRISEDPQSASPYPQLGASKQETVALRGFCCFRLQEPRPPQNCLYPSTWPAFIQL